MLLRPLIPLLAPLVVTAALAAPASAADYCVHQGGSCPAGSLDMSDDLPAALAAADAETDADRIDIGPGTYVGRFQYASANPVTITGAGRDATRLASPGSSVLSVNRAHIAHLRVIVPAENGATGLSAADGSVLEDVAVDPAGPASQRVGVSLRKSATLVHSTVAMGNADFGVVTHPDGKTPTVSDSTISARTGVNVINDPSGDTLVRRSTVSGFAPLVVGGISLTAENVVLHPQNASAAAITAECVNGRNGSFTGDHLTIVGHGASAGVFAGCELAGKTVNATMTNSVVTAVQHALVRSADVGGTANVKATFSDLRSTPVLEQGAGTTTLSDTLDVDPGFAEDGVHLTSSSPLVDAGAPGDPAQATDRDGNPRLSGARQDIGAFELQLPPVPGVEVEWNKPPSPPEPAPPAGEPAVQTAGNGLAVTDAALLAELRRTLRGRRGRTYRHRFLVPGTLRIRWVAKGRVIATAWVARASTGTARLRVKPTNLGRRLLRGHGRLRLSVKASFAPAGRKALRASRRTTLRPR